MSCSPLGVAVCPLFLSAGGWGDLVRFLGHPGLDAFLDTSKRPLGLQDLGPRRGGFLDGVPWLTGGAVGAGFGVSPLLAAPAPAVAAAAPAAAAAIAVAARLPWYGSSALGSVFVALFPCSCSSSTSSSDGGKGCSLRLMNGASFPSKRSGGMSLSLPLALQCLARAFAALGSAKRAAQRMLLRVFLASLPLSGRCTSRTSGRCCPC